MKGSALNKLNKLNALNQSAVSALIIAIIAFLTFPALAQTNITRAVPGRYLLIVETSHSMKSRSDGTIKTVGSLLINGMSGQIKSGDSIGVWTYNQELHTGKLPLQRWSSMVQRDVVSAILSFLKEQKYEKEPAISSVRPAMEKVVKDSELITIVLVSSGEEPMVGTPFDDKINDLYKTWREEQQKSRMPFVTVLRAKRGTIIGYSVTPSPWQVEMPAWPPEPVVKAAEPTPPPPKVQPSTVPPLIVTGKKTKPIEASGTASDSAATTPDAAPISTTTQSPPGPATNALAGSGVPESPGVSAQKRTNSASDDAVFQRNAVKSQETPQPSEPVTPLTKEPVATNQVPNSETLPPVTAANSNASNPAPAVIAQNVTPPPQEATTGVATPANGVFSNKIIWIAGLAVIGIACVTLIVLTRRPRSERISLITRSLEREKK